MNAQGKVHKYGDNVDTDVIIPARYLNTADHKELASHCMEDIDADFVNKVNDGDIMVATNAQARRARRLFKELEGSDIYPAPAVALASLIKMVESGSIDKSACIMLNITGAGEEAAKKNRELWYLKPSKVFPLTVDVDDVVTYVETLF